jgi:hypothetical protein
MIDREPAYETRRSTTITKRVLLVGSLFAAFALGLLSLREAAARGDGPPTPPAGAGPAQSPSVVRGTRFFDQAINWINDGRPGIGKVNSFYASLESVKLDVGENHQEGYLRLWFGAPDKFRQEWRQRRELVRGTPTTTKILNGDRMWILQADGTQRRMHGTPDGQRAIPQLKDDRKRLYDLAKFLTLQGLKGAGTSFEDMGPVTPKGPFAGNWTRVKRTLRGGAQMMFYFAYQADAQGRAQSVSYPGVVVVMGDARNREPTEAYVLKNWKPGQQFRFPGQIEAYMLENWVPGAQWKRFLLAYPADIRMNPILDEAKTFLPPAR